MVIQAIQSVLSLLILIGVGFVITGQRWFPEWGADFLSKLTVRVAIPCYMFYSVVTTSESPQALLTLFASLPIPFFTILLSLGISVMLVRLFRISVSRRGVFMNAVTFSNTVLIGFMVVQSLFGEKALPDAMIYYMANTTLFWTFGTFLLRRDKPGREKADVLQEIRNIFSPPLIGFIVGILFVLARVSVPDFIFSPITMMKQMTTPIAMIFTGSIIRRTDFKTVKLSRELSLVLAVRFLLTPIFMILLLRPLPVTLQLKQVFFLLATMPAMTQLGIMAKESGSDTEFASVLVTVTTLVSMLILPFYMVLLTQWHVLGVA